MTATQNRATTNERRYQIPFHPFMWTMTMASKNNATTQRLPCFIFAVCFVVLATLTWSSSASFFKSSTTITAWEDFNMQKVASSSFSWWSRRSNIAASSSSSSINTILVPKNAKNVHLVILVHGWMGRPSELAYVQQALERQVALQKTAGAARQQQQQELNNNDKNENNNEEFFVFYSATANDKQTSDGIAAGGKRLAQQVNQLVDSILTQQQQQQKEENNDTSSSSSRSTRTTTTPSLSLSFIGNSLGGLYARYALSEIPSIQQCSNNNSGSNSNSSSSSSFLVRPAVFCTTATPHLGVSSVDGHAYIPNIPRALEYVVAHSIQPTGRDLFRFTGIIADLAMQDKFMTPLAAFEHRILYANAFGTDFQVPTTTAAILTRSSSTSNNTDDSSIHYSLHGRNNNKNTTTTTTTSSSSEVDDTETSAKQCSNEYSFYKHTHQTLLESLSPSWIPLVVETRRRQEEQQQQQQQDHQQQQQQLDGAAPTSAQLAQRLDSLGWTKIFCDVRSSLPSIPIPSFFASSLLSALKGGDTSKRSSPSSSQESSTSSTSLQQQQERFNKEWYTSAELLELTATTTKITTITPVSSSETDDNNGDGGSSSNGNNRNSHHHHRWHLPAGHVVMVANSKSQSYSRFTAAGRPLMDELAARILSQILLSSQKPPPPPPPQPQQQE